MTIVLQPDQVAPPSRFRTGSSEWWIERLIRALLERQERFERLESYYTGTWRLSELAGQAWLESELATMFPKFLHANHARLIVGAAAQRLVVLGFRLGGELRVDTEAARIWRANEMDAESGKAHIEAMVKGECPVLVSPNPSDPSTPYITPQDPMKTIVWYDSGDRRRRRAALKTWYDDEVRRRYYTLYLPDRIEHWRDREMGQMDWWLNRLFGSAVPSWEPAERPGEPWQMTNPLGEVPVIVLPNGPRLFRRPEAEHEPVLSRIDQYNKTLMDMALTSHELAYPQRWAAGVEADEGEEVRDADTGELISLPRPSVRTGQTRWVTSPAPDAQFGQFAAATIDNYVKELRELRNDIATHTFTPYHFLLNMETSVPASGEAMTTAETPLVDKVRDHQRAKGGAWRQVMRLAFLLADDEPRARAMAAGRVRWEDAERRTESQHIDALGKMRVMLGIPREAAWERIPVAPDEIDRWNEMIAEEEAAGVAVPAPSVSGLPDASPPGPSASTGIA